MSNSLGKGFIDNFSNTMKQDQNKQVNQTSALTPQLPKTTGVNKKKVTNLQQSLVNVLATPQNAGMQQPQM